MHLKNYFNKKYAFQNIKKSKGVLAFFLGAIPIFNTLLLFSIASSSMEPLDLTLISFLTMLGAYFAPFVVSICLFGYIFKKKSVDFICSMPISRKTIFFTNMITGILLLVGMLVFTSILIGLVGLVTSNIIPLAMILDYLLIWVVTYVFSFVVFTIGVSLAGNSITALIVAVTLLFVVPYIVDYTTNKTPSSYQRPPAQVECMNDKCIPDYYDCNGDDTCLENKEDNRYLLYSTAVSKPTNFTLPYNTIRNMVTYPYEFNLYNTKSLMKMALISIVGIFVGYVFFTHRKMENNETSFKNEKLHVFIKGLLITPVLFVIFSVLSNQITTLEVLLFTTIIIAYYFLYDLITRRSIGNFLRTSRNLVCTVVIVFCSFFLIEKVKGPEKIQTLKSDRIEYIEIRDNTLSMSENDYPQIKNQDLIDEILKYTLTEYLEDISVQSRVLVKAEDGREFEYGIALPDASYELLLEKIKKSSDYAEFKDLKQNKLFAYRFSNSRYNKKADDDVREIMQAAFDNAIQNQLNDASLYPISVLFYFYDQGEIITYQLPSNADPRLEELLEEEITARNKNLAKKLDEKKLETITPYLTEGSASLPEDYTYLLSHMQEELKTFIKKYSDEKFDTEKNYLEFDFYTERENIFTTNRVNEFLELLEEKRESLKGDKDYEEWLKQNQIILEDTSEVEAETNVVD